MGMKLVVGEGEGEVSDFREFEVAIDHSISTQRLSLSLSVCVCLFLSPRVLGFGSELSLDLQRDPQCLVAGCFTSFLLFYDYNFYWI